MLHLVSKKNLVALLNCLESFEKGPRDPLTILNSFKTFEYEPSVEFANIIEKVKESIGAGITDKASKIFAFSIWMKIFPIEMQLQLSLMEINDFPNKIQLERIDNMYSKFRNSETSTSQPIVSNESQLITKLDNILNRLTILENKQSTPAYPNTHYQPQRNLPWTNRETNPTQRPFTATNNPNFCFYHNSFGTRARKCTQPCTFHQQSKN